MKLQYYSRKSNHKRELRALFIIIIIVSIGTIGYIVLEDYSFTNALYMTIVTISTVGYGEVEPLSDYGKIFTSIYILISIASVAYVAKVLSEKIIKNALLQNIGSRRIEKKINRMKDHIIIVGVGKTGAQAMLKLHQKKKKIVIIMQNRVKE